MPIANVILVAFNATLLVSGQFLWKAGIQRQLAPFAGFAELFRTMTSPLIMGGILIYVFATVLWLFILTRVQLSLAYPMQSLAYVFAVFAAAIFFDEPLTVGKVVGTLLIIAGISLIAATAHDGLPQPG